MSVYVRTNGILGLINNIAIGVVGNERGLGTLGRVFEIRCNVFLSFAQSGYDSRACLFLYNSLS